MKTNTLLIWGIVGLIAYTVYTTTRAIGGLIFLPRGINFNGGSIQIVMGVQNPSMLPVPISSFAGNLLLNNNVVGAVSNFTPIVIAPNQETNITLTVSPNVFGIANGVIDAIRNGAPDTYSAELQGTVNVNGFLFAIDQKLS